MKINKNILITKASGIVAPFSGEKLRTSLERAGADEYAVNRVLNEVNEKLYKGISTKKIYRIAFNLLKQISNPLAAKYHLKRGIMELGPSGFPFEKYVGEILSFQGYEIKLGQIMKFIQQGFKIIKS